LGALAMQRVMKLPVGATPLLVALPALLLLLLRAPLAAALASDLASESQQSPIDKTIALLTSLQAKVVSDGEAEEAAYHKYYEWCEDATRQNRYEIKTLKEQTGKLEAAIEKAASDIEGAETKIGQLTGDVASEEGSKQDATLIRNKEKAAFDDAEKELMQAVDMLTGAVNVLDREMQGGGASLVQAAMGTDDLMSVITGVSAVIDAASLSNADQVRLASLLQSQDEADDAGAPAPDAYKSHSTGIVDLLEDMKEKAESQLSELRRKETSAQHNYDLLEQSLSDATAAAKKGLADEKSAKGKASQEQATAEGDLEVAKKSIQSAREEMAHYQAECMLKARDHDATQEGRKEELSVLGKAKKVIQSSTGGAERQAYSLVQVQSTTKHHQQDRVLLLVQNLARTQRSEALSQLASRLAAVLRYGDDPFAKVKGLISDMIAKLAREAQNEAEEKAYCDEELKETTEKKGELEIEVASLTGKIDRAAAASEQLKQEVKDLQADMAELAVLQTKSDQIAHEAHSKFLQAQADYEAGLEGVRKALIILKDYYASKEEGSDSAEALLQDEASFTSFMKQPAPPQTHEKSAGAGASIIGLLEVVESDLAKNLALEETEDGDMTDSHAKSTQTNALATAEKDQDVKYKTKEFKALDKRLVELGSDRDTSNEELAAVLEYDDKLTTRCIAKPEAYEERKRRRDAEIVGLKEALSTLEGEAIALLQTIPQRRNIRGTTLASAA